MLTGVMLAPDATLAPRLRAPDVEQLVDEPHPADRTQLGVLNERRIPDRLDV